MDDLAFRKKMCWDKQKETQAIHSCLKLSWLASIWPLGLSHHSAFSPSLFIWDSQHLPPSSSQQCVNAADLLFTQECIFDRTLWVSDELSLFSAFVPFSIHLHHTHLIRFPVKFNMLQDQRLYLKVLFCV